MNYSTDMFVLSFLLFFPLDNVKGYFFSFFASKEHRLKPIKYIKKRTKHKEKKEVERKKV